MNCVRAMYLCACICSCLHDHICGCVSTRVLAACTSVACCRITRARRQNSVQISCEPVLILPPLCQFLLCSLHEQQRDKMPAIIFSGLWQIRMYVTPTGHCSCVNLSRFLISGWKTTVSCLFQSSAVMTENNLDTSCLHPLDPFSYKKERKEVKAAVKNTGGLQPNWICL